MLNFQLESTKTKILKINAILAVLTNGKSTVLKSVDFDINFVIKQKC